MASGVTSSIQSALTRVPPNLRAVPPQNSQSAPRFSTAKPAPASWLRHFYTSGRWPKGSCKRPAFSDQEEGGSKA